MSILLDPQIFLWYISGDTQLPLSIRQAERDPHNLVFLSVVALWEIIIKYQLGKLPLSQPPEIYLPIQRRRHRIESLPVDEASVIQLSKLPPYHRDRFDRLMICQAIEHELTFATVDHRIQSYPVKLLG